MRRRGPLKRSARRCSRRCQSGLGAQGAEFPNLTGAQFDGFIKAELKKWAQVVKASGAKLD
jgi:tripartite-type tricarboxylate transporter receptor subunit TctC